MCEQCLAKAVLYVGPDSEEVLHGYYLVKATQNGNKMKKGDWGLVQSNDPDFIWSVTPVCDPAEGISEDQENALPKGSFKAFDRAVADLEKALNKGCFDKTIWLGIAMIKAGYRSGEHGYRSAHWLCNYLAKFLKTATIFKEERT